MTLRRLIPVLLLVLFAPLGCSSQGAQPGVSPVDGPVPTIGVPPSPTEKLGPHGLVPAQIGVATYHTNIDGDVEATMTVVRIERLQTCRYDPSGQPLPAGRYLLAVFVEIQLLPNWENAFFPGDWDVIRADGTQDPVDRGTLQCLEYEQQLVGLQAGTSVEGIVAIETAAESGWVTMRHLAPRGGYMGWEWPFDVTG